MINICSVSRLGTIMTATVDSSQCKFPDDTCACIEFKNYTTDTVSDKEDCACSKCISKRSSNWWIVPQESFSRLKVLLPVSSATLQNSLPDAFKNDRSIVSSYLITYFPLSLIGSGLAQLNNSNRQYTFAVRMPCNSIVCITFSSAPSEKICCSWIGPVYDCYILHGKGVKSPFRRFEANDIVAVANECVEEELPIPGSCIWL